LDFPQIEKTKYDIFLQNMQRNFFEINFGFRSISKTKIKINSIESNFYLRKKEKILHKIIKKEVLKYLNNKRRT